MTEVTKELVLGVLDAVIDVVGRHTSMAGRVALKTLKGFIYRFLDEQFFSDVKSALAPQEAATSASAPGAASAPPELRQVALRALDALAARVARYAVLPVVVATLREAVEGPMFDLVYDYLIEKGLAAPRTTAAGITDIVLIQTDLRAAADRVHNACADETKEMAL